MMKVEMNYEYTSYELRENCYESRIKWCEGTRDEHRGIIKGGGTWAFERVCEEEHEDHDSSLCLLITMEGMYSIDIRWSWIWNCVIYVLHNQTSGQ